METTREISPPYHLSIPSLLAHSLFSSIKSFEKWCFYKTAAKLWFQFTIAGFESDQLCYTKESPTNCRTGGLFVLSWGPILMSMAARGFQTGKGGAHKVNSLFI